MTDQHESFEYRGFGLLDMLAVVIEGWRPLVIIPALAAMVAAMIWFFAGAMSITAHGTVTLAMETETAELILQPGALVAAAAKRGATLPEEAVEVVAGDAPGSFTINVHLVSADALAVVRAVHDAYTAPDFEDPGRLLLEQALQAQRGRQTTLQETIAALRVALEGRGGRMATVSSETISAATTIDMLSASALQSELSLMADEEKLMRWQSPKAIAEPKVLERNSLPSLRVVLTFAVLLSGFVVGVYLFARDFWRRAELDPLYAGKLVRIRTALGRGAR